MAFKSGSSSYAKSSLRVSTKVSAPRQAVPPSVQPLKTSYSKMGLQPQPFGGFGNTGLAETPSLLGMGSKAIKTPKQRLR